MISKQNQIISLSAGLPRTPGWLANHVVLHRRIFGLSLSFGYRLPVPNGILGAGSDGMRE